MNSTQSLERSRSRTLATAWPNPFFNGHSFGICEDRSTSPHARPKISKPQNLISPPHPSSYHLIISSSSPIQLSPLNISLSPFHLIRFLFYSNPFLSLPFLDFALIFSIILTPYHSSSVLSLFLFYYNLLSYLPFYPLLKLRISTPPLFIPPLIPPFTISSHSLCFSSFLSHPLIFHLYHYSHPHLFLVYHINIL